MDPRPAVQTTTNRFARAPDPPCQRPVPRAPSALSEDSTFEELRAAVSSITEALHLKLRAAEQAAHRAQAAAERVEAQKADLFRREQELERKEWAAWERERHLRLREQGMEPTKVNGCGSPKTTAVSLHDAVSSAPESGAPTAPRVAAAPPATAAPPRPAPAPGIGMERRGDKRLPPGPDSSGFLRLKLVSDRSHHVTPKVSVSPESTARKSPEEVVIKAEQPEEEAPPRLPPSPTLEEAAAPAAPPSKSQRRSFAPTVPASRRGGEGPSSSHPQPPPPPAAAPGEGGAQARGGSSQPKDPRPRQQGPASPTGGHRARRRRCDGPNNHSQPAANPRGQHTHNKDWPRQGMSRSNSGGQGDPTERGPPARQRGRASYRGRGRYRPKWWSGITPVPSQAGGSNSPEQSPEHGTPQVVKSEAATARAVGLLPAENSPPPLPLTKPPPPATAAAPPKEAPRAAAAGASGPLRQVKGEHSPGYGQQGVRLRVGAVPSHEQQQESAGDGQRPRGLKREASPATSSDSEADLPLSARQAQKKRRKSNTIGGAVTLLEALEEDAPQLLELLQTEGLVDDMPLLDLDFENHRFEGLHWTLASVVRSATGGGSATAAANHNSHKEQRYSMAALKCLLERVRAYSEARLAGNLPDLGYADPSRVMWGWCRELRSFIFVFEAANRIVVEQPEYGKATYFFEMEQNLTTMEQLSQLVACMSIMLSRLVACMSIPGIRRSDILSNDKAVLRAFNLTEEQKEALAVCGWDGDRGIGSLLNYSERVVHDHSMGANEWKDKIGKHVARGALMGRVSRPLPTGQNTGQPQQLQQQQKQEPDALPAAGSRGTGPVGPAAVQPIRQPDTGSPKDRLVIRAVHVKLEALD